MLPPFGLRMTRGVWTPTIAGSTTAGAQTYATQAGRWRKASDVIWIEAFITLTAKDAATAGNLEVRGLPFAAGAGGGSFAIGYWSNLTLTANYTQVGLMFNASGTSANLTESKTGAGANFLTAAALAATTTIVFSGVYFQ